MTKKKSALLLLHGGPGLDDSYFYPYLSPLQESFSLYSYAHGRSEEYFKGMETLETEFLKFYESIPEDKIVLFGHSFGSALAQYVLKKHSLPKVKKLILCAWAYSIDFMWVSQKENEEFFKKIEPIRNERNPKLLPDRNLIYQKNMLDVLPLHFIPSYQEEGRKVFEKIEYRADIYSKLYSTFLSSGFSYFDDFKSPKLPILSIVGKEDKVIPYSYIKPVLSYFKPEDSLELQAGHFPFVERGKEIVEKVKTWTFQQGHLKKGSQL